MARMHSRRKGKSGSKHPLPAVPVWVPYKEKEVERLVVKYAKMGKTPSELGMILRDMYGITSIRLLTKKKVNAILRENDLSKSLPEDMFALIRKLITVRQHLEENKHDQSARRGVLLTISKIRRLVKYYKRTKRLSSDWELDMERLKMYLE